jgi:catecholate siderophore receptor
VSSRLSVVCLRAIPRSIFGSSLLIASVFGLSGLAGATPLQPPTQPTGNAAAPLGRTYRFDVPSGSVEGALAAFETVTGLRVVRPPDIDLASLTSRGVSGVFTPDQALDRLLAGTGFACRRNASGAFALTAVIAPEVVEVAGRLSPYAAQQSASATRTDTPLRDIPQTVNVIPREVLIDQRAQSVADAVKYVPGVSVAQGEGNRDQVVLRGISTASDFYVNGVRDDQERFRDLYNVERIEIVQGPAAVLFGRGGAGGIVNLVTRRPVRGAASDATIEVGAYGHKRATTQVGLPLGDTGAFRVSLMAGDSDGFRNGFFLRRYGVNPTAGVSLGRNTTLTLGFEHLRDHRLADRGIPSRQGRPVDVPASQLFGSTDQNDARSGVDSASATVEHRFSSSLTFRNTFLTGRYGKSYQNVYPGSAVSATDTLTLSAYNHDIDRTNAFNQSDLIYATEFGGMSHTLLAGVEVGHQYQDELRHTAAAIPRVPVTDSIRNANFATAPVAIDRHASTDIAAGYAQDQIALSAHWKALVGARVDRFHTAVDDHLPGAPDLTSTDTVLSPRAGAIYQPTGTVSIYSSYSYTFVPSGLTLGLTPSTAVLGPENAKNYEAGVKLDLFQKRLAVSAALFRLDRNNVKNADPSDPIRLVLTGQQRTDGLVLSVAGNITPDWKIYGGFANMFARITADTTAAPAGRTVGLVPRNQVTVWSTYDFTAHIGAGAGLVSQSKMYASFSNQVELPAFSRVDAMVSCRVGRYRLAVNAENVLNTKYYSTANSDNNISPGSPRNVQLSLRALF